jgi:hypothetical protein
VSQLRRRAGAATPTTVREHLGEADVERNRDVGRWRRERTVARIEGVDPKRTERRVRVVLEAQAGKWGTPLLNHLLYARRPSILQGVRAMWAGLDASGLLDPGLVALVNRRVAALNGCVF